MKSKKQSISTRLVGIVLAITILGMGLIAAISTVMSGSSLLEESLGKISESTALEASRIDGWLKDQSSYFSAMAVDLAFQDSYDEADLAPILQSHQQNNAQYFDVYMGFPDGTGVFATGWVPDYAGGWISYERGWYQGAVENPGIPYITEPYTDSQTGQLCITVAKAVLKDGNVAGVCAADMFIDVLSGIVSSTVVAKDSFAFLTDGDGGLLVHPNEAYGPDQNDNFQKLSEIEGGHYAELWSMSAADGSSVKIKSADGVSRYYTAQTIPATGWKLFTAVPVSVVNAPITQLLVVVVPVVVLVLVAAVVLLYITVRRIVIRPVRDITRAATRLATGDTDISLQGGYKGEIADLSDSFMQMAHSISEQAQATRRIAGGDLTVHVPVRSGQDVMGMALQDLTSNLGRIIASISAASAGVTSSADQISSNSQALAQGATEQASSVNQLSASISDMAGKLQQNEERTTAASTASGNILESARHSTEQMARMMDAVNEINNASSNISKVIKVIEDIAFQTNILALNAAVEAARAGAQGKGFAVVADEVRTLAAKSAQAASETTTLIQNSISKAAEGTRIAEETSQSLQAIIEGVEQTTSLMREVSNATSEQARAITQIDTGIEQVNQVVAANAATSEESAAAAHQLSSEARTLSQIVSEFQVGDEPRALPAPGQWEMTG